MCALRLAIFTDLPRGTILPEICVGSACARGQVPEGLVKALGSGNRSCSGSKIWVWLKQIAHGQANMANQTPIILAEGRYF